MRWVERTTFVESPGAHRPVNGSLWKSECDVVSWYKGSSLMQAVTSEIKWNLFCSRCQSVPSVVVMWPTQPIDWSARKVTLGCHSLFIWSNEMLFWSTYFSFCSFKPSVLYSQGLFAKYKTIYQYQLLCVRVCVLNFLTFDTMFHSLKVRVHIFTSWNSIFALWTIQLTSNPSATRRRPISKFDRKLLGIVCNFHSCFFPFTMSPKHLLYP